MTRISKGTVSLANDSTSVTLWDGVVLSEITAPLGSHVIIEGVSNYIKSRTSTTEFELEEPHTGAGGTGLNCMISAMTPSEISIGKLNARTATVIQQLSALDANGRGLFYNLIGVTGANDPGPGKIAFNSSEPSAVTEIYFDVLDANEGGREVAALIDLWRVGTVLTLRSLASTAFAAYQVVGVETVAGWRKVSVSYVGSDGALAAEPIAVDWNIVGEGIQINRAGTFAQRDLYDTEEAPAAKGFTYASVNGADGNGPPTVLYIKQSSDFDDWGPAIPFQGPESEPRVAVTLWDPGRPGAGEVMWSGIFDVPVSFPANMASPNATSRAIAGAAATAEAVLSLRKNEVEFATLTFAASGTVGTFAGAATDFSAGDRLSIVAPDPRDASLAQIAITLAGAR